MENNAEYVVLLTAAPSHKRYPVGADTPANDITQPVGANQASGVTTSSQVGQVRITEFAVNHVRSHPAVLTLALICVCRAA